MLKIPSGWQSAHIGSWLAESREPGTNGAEAKKLTVKLYGRGVVPKTERQPGSAKTKYYRRRAGQFIYSKLDFLNGAFAIVPPELDGRETTLDLPAFDFVGEVDRRWFLYFVSRPDFYESKRGLSRGSRKARRVSPKDFLGMEVPIPPLPEQKKIAEILGSVDEAIQATQAVIDQTRKVKQRLLQQLLTRGIGHTRFKQTEIGEIPESWEVVELAGVTERLHNGFVGKAAPHYRDVGVPYLMSRNVRPNRVDLSTLTHISSEFHDAGAKRSQLLAGDFLVVQSGHVGTACTVPPDLHGANCHAVIVGTPRATRLRGEFVAYYLNSPVGKRRLQQIFVGSTVPHINTKHLRRFKVPIPSLTEQAAIEAQGRTLDAVLVSGDATLRRYSAFKAGLMSDLLSGRVRVKVDT